MYKYVYFSCDDCIIQCTDMRTSILKDEEWSGLKTWTGPEMAVTVLVSRCSLSLLSKWLQEADLDEVPIQCWHCCSNPFLLLQKIKMSGMNALFFVLTVCKGTGSDVLYLIGRRATDLTVSIFRCNKLLHYFSQ